jgi:hypothetical protein
MEDEPAELAVEAELYRFESHSFGARRLDCAIPAEELCEQLAIDVLRALDGRRKITSLIRGLGHSRKA